MAQLRKKEPRGPEYLQLGYRLTDIRKSLGLSQADAAQKIGIPQSTYSGYETGSRKITLSTLKQIAGAYGVSVDSLLGNAMATAEALTLEEEEVIKMYRQADNDTKRMVEKLLRMCTENK